jgi:diaminopimelate epimerase
MNHIFYPNKAPDSISWPFAKYQGNGNDFIIVNSCDDQFILPSLLTHAAKICDRHFGIGADGIIVLLKKGDAFLMTVINADGSLASNCGNGLRCAAAYIFKRWSVNQVRIELALKTYYCEQAGDQIWVSMGACQITREPEIFFKSCAMTAQIAKGLMGNEHFLMFFNEPVNDIDLVLEELRAGSLINDDMNIGFIFPRNADQYFSWVYERGVGFTKSCGSGACAAASFIHMLFPDILPKKITITQPGGSIDITIGKLNQLGTKTFLEIAQAGPCQEVFTGLCEGAANW